MAQSILGPGMGVTAEIKAGPQTRHQLPALATCEISRRRDERTLIPAPPQHCRKFKAFTCRIFAIAAGECFEFSAVLRWCRDQRSLIPSSRYLTSGESG